MIMAGFETLSLTSRVAHAKVNPHVISTALVTCRKVFVNVASDRQSLSPSFERNGNGVTIWRERKGKTRRALNGRTGLSFAQFKGF